MPCAKKTGMLFPLSDSTVEKSFGSTPIRCFARYSYIGAPYGRWRLSSITWRQMPSVEVKPQSAMMPWTSDGRSSPAAIRTVVAPIEMPTRYTGSPPARFSEAKRAQSRQSRRSRIPKPMFSPPLLFCPLCSQKRTLQPERYQSSATSPKSFDHEDLQPCMAMSSLLGSGQGR